MYTLRYLDIYIRNMQRFVCHALRQCRCSFVVCRKVASGDNSLRCWLLVVRFVAEGRHDCQQPRQYKSLLQDDPAQRSSFLHRYAPLPFLFYLPSSPCLFGRRKTTLVQPSTRRHFQLRLSLVSESDSKASYSHVFPALTLLHTFTPFSGLAVFFYFMPL